MNKHLKSWRNFLVTTAAFFLAFQNVSAQTSDSIPFLFRGYNRGHLYIPVTINDSIHCNVVLIRGLLICLEWTAFFWLILDGNHRISIMLEQAERLETQW